MITRVLKHGAIALFLTLLTQLGGIAWVLSRFTKRSLVVFVLLYGAFSLCAAWVAPLNNRVALSCISDGPLQMQNPMYCLMNRHYVAPELAEVLRDAANEMDKRHPGTVTQVLDGNFPFLNGFPLLPHLSHSDGEKADLAFYYGDTTGYLPGETPSPIGYFAFEDGPTDCPDNTVTLRWDMGLLQPLWPDLILDKARTHALLNHLQNDPRVSKVLLEPHLKQSLGLVGDKIRFQGCGAARHDDHIHLQL